MTLRSDDGFNQLREWFIRGVFKGYTHMLTVRLSFGGWRPQYTENDDHCRELMAELADRIEEVYDLRADMDSQLAEVNAWHPPGAPPPAPKPGMLKIVDRVTCQGQLPLRSLDEQNATPPPREPAPSPTLTRAGTIHLRIPGEERELVDLRRDVRSLKEQNSGLRRVVASLLVGSPHDVNPPRECVCRWCKARIALYGTNQPRGAAIHGEG